MPMIRNVHILILILSILLFSCTKKSEVEKYKVFGTDPLDDIAVMEERSEALLHWAQKGLRNEVLIHIDAHDGLETVSSQNMQQIGEMLKGKQWEELRRSRGTLIKNSNYLYAAVQLGIIDKIYWIIPYRFFEDIPLAKEKIQEFLRNSPSGFNKDEISGMRMIEGCLTGLLAEVDIHICSPRTLPRVFVPAIISMDVSFFPTYAKEAGTSNLRAFKWVMDYITFKQKLLIRHSEVSYGIVSGSAEVIHRYIGDQLIEVLGNPLVLKAQSPPELWQFRDMADNMLSGGEDKLVEEFLVEPLKKYPDDPALRLMHATAIVRLQKYEEAFKETDEICSMDKNYCLGFIYLGNAIEDNVWKKKFAKRAQQTLPENMNVKKIASPVMNGN